MAHLEECGHHIVWRRGPDSPTYKPWRAYIRRDFHPSQQESTLSNHWLDNNREAYTLVGTRAEKPA